MRLLRFAPTLAQVYTALRGGPGWGRTKIIPTELIHYPRLAVDGGCDMIHHCEIISPLRRV